MQTFTFNIDQIKEIYDAGRDRGSDEAAAFEWGSSPSGKRYDNCIEAIHDIVNSGKKWGDTDYVQYDTVESWFK